MNVFFCLEFLSAVFFLLFFFVSIIFWGSYYVVEWSLVNFCGVNWCVEFLFDGVGLSFLSVVMLVVLCVLRFSWFYMSGETNYGRFHCVLGLFVLSMMVFILIPNLFGLMIGWDGLGVTSYLLVIHYPCSSSLSAGMLTGLTNRLGDSLLVICILLMGVGVGDWFFVFDMGLIGFLLVFGGMTKSAQYPFSAWLPAAMAAPTPVSSLVHSSTLVTAGVFLFVRSYYSLNELVLSIVYWSSLITLVVAGFAACFEYDLKKVVALSTLSQVSVMMFSLSVGFLEMAFFHLVCHAVIKAMLFMCVGFVISVHSQDIRRLGWDSSEEKWLKGYFSVSCFSLCGLPFFSGYYSKDYILEGLLGSSFGVLGFFMLSVGVMFSSWYSFRLVYYSLFSGFQFGWMGLTMARTYGDSSKIHICCFPLLLASIFLGCLGYKFLSNLPVLFYSGSVKFFYLFLPLIGVSLCSMDIVKFSDSRVFYYWDYLGKKEAYFSFFDGLGFLDKLSGQIWVMPTFSFGDSCYGYLDQGWWEYAGPGGIRMLSKFYLGKDEGFKSAWYSSTFILYICAVVIFSAGSM